MPSRPIVLAQTFTAPTAPSSPAPPVAATNPCGATGFNGQSNLVPAGFPTPTTATECLKPDGPPHDPGPLTWAHPGPYIASSWSDFSPSSFTSSQRLATTYYFYWHDMTNRAAGASPASNAGRSDGPPDPAHYSFLLPETHLREFNDMLDAGLNFVLPVYWGEPGHPGRTTAQTYPHYWSTEGIPAMVNAEDQLASAGQQLPIGMFYDTTILANADLTTPAGKDYFYVNVRDFYSRIPPKYWAAIDGKPIVWLYDTQWVSRFDQSALDYLSDRFAQDFGGLRPYIVRELQWAQSKGLDPPQPVTSDALYGWGAAANGYDPDPALTVAEVGPGFLSPGCRRTPPSEGCLNVDRQNGAFYKRQLQAAVASPHKLLAVETWNEFSEGTEVAETTTLGRMYIDLTRQFVDQFEKRP